MSALLQQMLQDSPTGLWLLDDASGNAADIAGNNPGIVTGAPARKVNNRGMIGSSLSVGNTFSPGTGVPNLGASSWTIEAWVRTQVVAGNGRTILRWEASAGQNLVTIDGASGKAVTWVNGTTATSAARVDDDAVHHLVGVRDKTSAKTLIYVDKVVVETVGSGADTAGYGLGGVHIGHYGGDTSNDMVGWLSAVALYPTALSSDRIKAHYEAGIRSGVMY